MWFPELSSPSLYSISDPRSLSSWLQSLRQSLEAGHTGLLLFTLQGQLAEDILHAFAECANLDELGLNAEEQTYADQQENQDVVSQEAVDLHYQRQQGCVQRIHNYPPMILFYFPVTH